MAHVSILNSVGRKTADPEQVPQIAFQRILEVTAKAYGLYVTPPVEQGGGQRAVHSATFNPSR